MLEVRGHGWRARLAFGLTYAFVQQAYYLFRHGHFEPAMLLVVGVLVAIPTVFTSSKRFHLRIVNGMFSGPAPSGFRRIKIPVAEIDRERSAKPNLFGGWTVWSRSGTAIYIDPITVSKAGRTQILRALGLIEA